MSSVGSDGTIPGSKLYFASLATDNSYMVHAARVESQTPIGYRLANKDDTLILQGAYQWNQGLSGGVVWKDIETVEYGS